VMKGMNADGTANCVADADTNTTYGGGDFALANRTCASGVMTGISSTGLPICSTTVLKDWVNANCYLYFGQRDECDACTTVPNPLGRVRGDGCSVISDSLNPDTDCQDESLNGETIHMFGLAVDGTMDSNDKLHVALRCF
jgi:hypothetical protein